MRAKRRVVRDEHSRGNYALVALVSLLAVLTVGSFIVQTSESPLYSAKPRIVAEGGSGSGATADLTITDIISNEPIIAGNPVTITAIVKNIGNAPAVGQISRGWDFNGPYGGFGGAGCCQNISLNPGQSTTIYTTFNSNTTGNWSVSASVGAQNFLEQNYNNNERTESFNVVSGIDITPPVISNIVSVPHANSANILWDTNENANSRVDYGTVSGVYVFSASNTPYVLSHNVLLNGLASGTTYYYRVKSFDIAGNDATSSEYTFSTLIMNGTGNSTGNNS